MTDQTDQTDQIQNGTYNIPLWLIRQTFCDLNRNLLALSIQYDELVARRNMGATDSQIDAAWERYLEAKGQYDSFVAFLEAASVPAGKDLLLAALS